MAKNYAGNPYAVTENYIASRAAAFQIKGDIFGIKPEHFDQVYGVIVDIPLSPIVMGTLICYINGAVNLFFNDGSQVPRDALLNRTDVAKIGQAFVIASQNAFESAEKINSYPLPTSRVHYVYLLTGGGILRHTIDPQSVNTNPAKKKLYVSYSAVMDVLKEVNIKNAAKFKKSDDITHIVNEQGNNG